MDLGRALRPIADRHGLYRPLSRLHWSLRRRRVLVAYDNLTVSTFLCYTSVQRQLEAATRRSWVFMPVSEVNPADLYSFHTVILQRSVSEGSIGLLEAARAGGCRTIYDADDALFLIDEVIDDPQNQWRVYFGGARAQIVKLLASVDTVKVYSPSAVPIFRRHNPSVVAIRPFHLFTGAETHPREPGPVRVGFLGSYYKDAEFAPLVEPIRELLDGSLPLTFEFFGFCPAALEGDSRIVRIPWERDYHQFRARLAQRQWDIGLAPLRDLDFNRCKSNVKYREYAAAGIAGIFSRAEIYSSTVDDRRTGLLVSQEDSAAWREAIVELAGNAELRQDLTRNALADLRANYRLETYVKAVAELIG